MLKVTVTQLNRYVKAVLEEDSKLREVYVKGEIASFTRHKTSGHCYFKLADEESSVKAVLFVRNAQMLEFEPQDGMAVLARASVGVYERDGAYQLYVTELIPQGAGALAVALEQRRERLAAQGAFDPANKRPLPAYPRRIGVVTSKSGAALQDIRTVLERRWPLATLVVSPSAVQGSEAPASLKAALEVLDQHGGCDVIILSRGGGSSEELWAFNDEALVLAVHRCQTPVLSAVGHETDTTLCDWAADARAPTPSAAAELATPEKGELERRLKQIGQSMQSSVPPRLQAGKDGVARLEQRLQSAAKGCLQTRALALRRLEEHPLLRSPAGSVIKCKEKVDICTKALYNSRRIFMQQLETRLAGKAALLDSLSPLRVLERGYSLVLREGRAVSSGGELSPGDEVELRFGRGGAQATVVAVEED